MTTTTTAAAESTRRTRLLPTLSAGDTLTVVAWRDATVEQTAGAMLTDSDDVMIWCTPWLGATAVLMAHRFARHATNSPTSWSVDDIARTFGVAPARALHTLERLARFGIIRCHDRTIAVRLWIAPLTNRQRCQLPAYLAASYEAR